MNKNATGPEAAVVKQSAEGKTLRPKTVRGKMKVSQLFFSRLMATSPRTVAGWEAGQKMSEQSKRRLQEIERLGQALATIMKPSFIGPWLDSPNPAFGGLKPVEVIERGDIGRLWRMIFELQSGQPA